MNGKARGNRPEPALPAAPALAPPVALRRAPPHGVAVRPLLWSVLLHLLPNARAVAAGDTQAETLHQLRVALRRLRTALRLLRHCRAALDPAWEPALALAFRGLGAQRDRDALLEWLPPALQAVGLTMPALPPPPPAQAAAVIVNGEALRRAVAGLYTLARDGRGNPRAGHFAERSGAYLESLHGRIRHDARRFARLPIAQQHVVRKRVKRLRYVAEFCAALAPRRAMQRHLRSLRNAQDALGELQNLDVARRLIAPSAATDPAAAQALAWLESQWRPVVARCQRVLERIEAPPTSLALRRLSRRRAAPKPTGAPSGGSERSERGGRRLRR